MYIYIHTNSHTDTYIVYHTLQVISCHTYMHTYMHIYIYYRALPGQKLSGCLQERVCLIP